MEIIIFIFHISMSIARAHCLFCLWQVGVVTYSEFGRLEWDLNDAQSSNNVTLVNAIRAIPHIGSFTNTPDGLQFAREQIFNTAGDRSVNWWCYTMAIMLYDVITCTCICFPFNALTRSGCCDVTSARTVMSSPTIRSTCRLAVILCAPDLCTYPINIMPS